MSMDLGRVVFKDGHSEPVNYVDKHRGHRGDELIEVHTQSGAYFYEKIIEDELICAGTKHPVIALPVRHVFYKKEPIFEKTIVFYGYVVNLLVDWRYIPVDIDRFELRI